MAIFDNDSNTAPPPHPSSVRSSQPALTPPSTAFSRPRSSITESKHAPADPARTFLDLKSQQARCNVLRKLCPALSDLASTMGQMCTERGPQEACSTETPPYTPPITPHYLTRARPAGTLEATEPALDTGAETAQRAAGTPKNAMSTEHVFIRLHHVLEEHRKQRRRQQSQNVGAVASECTVQKTFPSELRLPRSFAASPPRSPLYDSLNPQETLPPPAIHTRSPETAHLAAKQRTDRQPIAARRRAPESATQATPDPSPST